MKIYVAGALTHLKNQTVKDLYIEIGKMAEGLGYDATVPHVNIEQNDAFVSPQFIYQADSKAVREADIMIAYVGEPSLGVGMEIEIANKFHTLVVLLHERDYKVSRMVTGSPNVIHAVEFDHKQEALDGVEKVLKGLRKSFKR